MRIALAQLNFRIGDFEGNEARISQSIHRAKAEKADLILFPELAVTGHYPNDLLLDNEFVTRVEQTIQRIATDCVSITAIVGGPAVSRHGNNEKVYNAAWVLSEGKVNQVFYKSHLSSQDIFDEKRYFVPAPAFNGFTLNEKRIAITIGHDIWECSSFANEHLNRDSENKAWLKELQQFNPQLILNLSSLPFAHNRESLHNDNLIETAKQFAAPLVYINLVGGNGEILYDGGSRVISVQGGVVYSLKQFEEDFYIFDTEATMKPEPRPGTSGIAKIHDALVMGIRDYFHKTGFSKATLGLSGGIDSAVVAVLAAEALGPENVKVLLLPSEHSTKHSIDDAMALVKNLNISYKTIEIHKAVSAFEKGLQPLFEGFAPDVTEENIQARARGIYLMALSNKFGYILLNTSNKSEYAVGYGTLYGDMNGSLAVLGDIYKTEVYQLANFINRNKEIIPLNSIAKPPSAELRPGQKDSDSLPPYDILDKILYRYIEENRSPKAIVSMGFEPEMVQRVVKMVTRSEFKRFQAAPILRVSSKAFGTGRRMPLVAVYE